MVTSVDTRSDVVSKKARMDVDRHEEGVVNGIGRTLLVKKLSTFATVPTKGSSHAAGYDLYR